MSESTTRLEATLRSHAVGVGSPRRGATTESTHLPAFSGAAVNRRGSGRAMSAVVDRVEAGGWESTPVEATAFRGEDDA